MCTSNPPYFTAFWLIVLLIMVPAHAGTKLSLEKSLADDQLREIPNSMAAYLFESASATTPVAQQIFYEGEWQLVQKDSSRLLRLVMETDLLAIDERPLWFEVEADGNTVGVRQALSVSGVTFAMGNTLNMDGNSIANLNVSHTPVATDAANVGYVDQEVGTKADTAHNHDDRYYTQADIDVLISRIEALEAKLADVSITYDAASGLKTFNINNVGLHITSQSGHSIILDDTQGEERIAILDKTGNNGIEISSKDNSLTFLSEGDYIVDVKGRATLKSVSDFSIDSGANLSMDSNINMEILPAGNLTIGGVQTNITPSAQLSLTAPMTTISGNALLDLDGGIITLN